MEAFFNDIKIKALAGLFVVVMIVSFFSMDYERFSPSTTTMESAGLPLIMMQTENGKYFNELHGYTSDVDAYLINETVTPLQEDRKLNVVINSYGEEITKISYKIRKFSDLSLLENTTVNEFKNEKNKLFVTFKIKNLIENDTEYLMEINLNTKNYSNIRYYTKIFCSTDLKLQDKMNFVLEFNEWTFDKNKLDKVVPYIETKASGDNSNYGKVNINSTKASIGWGTLEPVVEQEIIPTIKEINREVASITLDYNIAALSAVRSYDRFKVNEYYRIRQSGDKMYLLNFERETNQIFDSRNDLMASSRINLGISSSESANVATSTKGKYTSFVRQGNLWCYDGDNNTFIRIFSFEDETTDNVREAYGHHDIKIMDVADNGDVNFIVYGYMNRGEHEGQIGISLCQYNSKDNLVNELIYIPVDVPYEVLQENVGEIAYIGGNGAFYILLDDSLYSIDLTSKEKMTEISGLTDMTYAVSADGTAIAYSLNGKLYDTDEIRIFNMAKNEDYVIRANEGDRLRVLGYIKNDLAYGIIHMEDVVEYDNGGIIFPMYKIEIIDSQNELIKDYAPDGIYVSDASVVGMRLNMTRVIKDGNDDYVTTTVDQLLNREENIQGTVANVEVVASDERKKEVYIDLVNKVSNVANVGMKTSRSVRFSQGETIRIDAQFTDAGRYYVYGYGQFRGSFTSLDRAIAMADATYGTVYDSSALVVWKKYKNSSASINGMESFLNQSTDTFATGINIITAFAGVSADAQNGFESGKNAIEIINDTGLRALQLQDVSLDNVLYYIDRGIPVIGRYSGNSYVIITGYNSKEVSLYNIDSGKMFTVEIQEASRNFAQRGNIFITYLR